MKNKIGRRKGLFVLVLTGLLAGSASGSVPPEIPELRTSEIFSPYFFSIGDNGSSEIQYGGPLQQGYWVTQSLVQTAEPTTSRPAVGLQQFIQLLESPAGILFFETHGWTNNMLVEAYSDEASALGAMQQYIQSGTVQADEVIYKSYDRYAIAVTPIFITRKLKAKHGLVYAMKCQFDWWPVWIDRGYVRAYVGFGGEVTIGTGLGVTQKIFGNMAGIRNDLGSYFNAPLNSAIDAAQVGFSPEIRIKPEAVAPDASSMRLYNAPRIVMADLRQDTDADGSFDKELYHFVFGRDIYPYNKNDAGDWLDYPSQGEKRDGQIAGQGPLKLVVRFSEPMKAEAGTVPAVLIPAGGGTEISLTPEGGYNGWSSVHMPDLSLYDTWTGRLASLEGVADGEARIGVQGTHKPAGAGLDSHNQGMDLDGDGQSFPPTARDTSVAFEKISPSSPTVGLVDTAQNGEPRPHGPFVGVANTMETRLWLHDIPRPDEEPGILFQAEGAPELRALEVGEVDAEGALVPEGRIWRTEAVGMFRSARLTSDAIPEGTSYGVLAEGGGGTGTTVYFGVDSTSPAIHYDLHVRNDLSTYIKVTATDTVSGVKDIFLTYDWPNLMEDALVQVGTGAPNLPVMSETFQLPDRVPGQVEEFQGYLVARDVGGMVNARNPIHTLRDSFMLSAIGGDGWKSPSHDSNVFGYEVGYSTWYAGSCGFRTPLPGDCTDDNPLNDNRKCHEILPEDVCGSFNVVFMSSEPVVAATTGTPTIIRDGVFLGADEVVPLMEIKGTDQQGSFLWGKHAGHVFAVKVEYSDAHDPYLAPSVPLINVGYDLLYGNAYLNPPGQALPAGNNVVVAADDTSIKFEWVGAGPDNWVGFFRLLLPPPDGAEPPPGNDPRVVDVAVQAPTLGPICVTRNYDAKWLSVLQENALWMAHYGLTGWEKLPSAVDTAGKTVTGCSPTASPFAIFISTDMVGHAPPGDASVASVGGDAIQLAWGAGANPLETMYRVYYATASADWVCKPDAGALKTMVEVKGESIRIPGLQAETAYQLQVCNPLAPDEGCGTPIGIVTLASGAAEVSSPDFESCAPPPTGPNPPGSVTAVWASSEALRLAWEANENPEGMVYQVLAATAGPDSCGVTPPVSRLELFASTSGVVSGLLPSTRYHLRVCNPDAGCATPIIAETTGAGAEPVSAPAFGACGQTFPPAALLAASRSSAAVELEWDANGNSPVAWYDVRAGTAAGCGALPPELPRVDIASSTRWLVSGLLPSTQYAFSACGYGDGCSVPILVKTLAAGQGVEQNPTVTRCDGSSSSSGLAISADAAGNLWEVVSAGSSVELAKFDSAGASLAGLPLPGAVSEGNWTIRFDPEGNAYAVGGASSEVEEGLQKVAVYKVAASGDVLLSSTVFENPWGLNDFAFDSAGDIWITGAVQTSGPPDFSGPVGIAMGLWRFEPATGQLSLKSSYAGDSGFDAGFGVQLDGSGDIWVVGFSSVAAAGGPNKLALALWKYDASGTSLLAGPFLRHGYMRDIEQDVNARLLASGDDLWVTATKTSAAGNLDMALLRYGLDGTLQSEKFWHSDTGGDELPTSILVGRNETITVAGGTGAGANELAVWRYTSEGVLEWARTMAGAGRANGMVYSGGMWLAAAGSGTPLKFTPGASLAGGEGTDAGGLDVLAPRTTVQIGEPKTPGNPVVVSTATLFSLSAEDDLAVVGDNLGIGVSEIHFLVDVTRESCEGVASDPAALQGTCANPIYSQPFTVSPGLHTVYYSAMDLAGHEEPIGSFRAAAAEVSVDTTAPVVALLSPSPSAEGISQLFSGVVQVIGTATDEHLASYSLKLSAGESFDPESNTTISQATVPVELGILGLLDTAAVEPGTYTLRLEARDLSGNSSVLDARMYLDVLGVDLVIGQTPGLNHPQGVASGPLGRVWVSDTNNDSLRVFEADGAPAATYSGLGLNKPQGLAFDGESFWLADTNNDRVVKLSIDGAVQASFGKPGKSSGFVPGAGLGEFNKPSAVAVAADGQVFVADTNNSRVQVLEEGAWRVIPLSAPLGGVSSEPAGLALDQDGNLLVSDQANNRVLKFDPAGNLVSTFGSYGALPGQFDKPQGIAASASGFVFVADRNNDRIQKFDRFGHVVAILGQNGKEPGQFNKPSSLALDAEGRLLVADSNNGRIQRLLPGSPSPAVVMVGKPKKVKQPVSDKGGKVKHPEGYKLDIPEGALAVQTAITIEPVKDPSLGVPAKTGLGKEALKGASEVLDLGPEGTRFSAPVLVSVPYDPKTLGGMAENDLKLFTWNTQSLAWEKVEKSWVSVSSRAVFALLEHFSLYQVMGIQPEATTSSDFNFRDVYAFPNPARGVNPTFRAQVGTADSVDITIYDSSGRVVEKDSCGTGQVKDLGNGMGSQLTFECVWDAHRVGSGVYTYMLRARKAGFKDVTVVKKVGLIK